MKHSITLFREFVQDPTHHSLALRDDEGEELDIYCLTHDSYIVSFTENDMYVYVDNCLGMIESTIPYGKCCQDEQ